MRVVVTGEGAFWRKSTHICRKASAQIRENPLPLPTTVTGSLVPDEGKGDRFELPKHHERPR
jgi:hypothetical protein